MRLIDTHCHIHEGSFGADGAAAVARAHAAGVAVMLTLGSNLADSEAAIAFAAQHEGVLAAAGVHPHDAKDADDAALDTLARLAYDPRVALVGEIGLDFYRNLSPAGDQMRVLERQLETATSAIKPIAVHVREAHEQMLPLLSAWSRTIGGQFADGRPLGVMHYFSAGPAEAARYVELGFVISIHTSVTHPKATLLQEVARQTPLDHLVLETDSPYGAPQRFRGKRNEPAYVAEAAAKVAELKSLSIEQVAEATTRNALRLLLGVGAANGPGNRE